MTLYDLAGLLVWGILLLLILLVFLPHYKLYKSLRGNKRKVAGEIMKDFGIGIMIGSAFKWSITELSYYISIIMGAVLIGLGAKMKSGIEQKISKSHQKV